VDSGLCWDDFDTARPPRGIRRCGPGDCSVRGCEGDLHCSGLCFRHERAWGQGPDPSRLPRSSPGPPAGPAAECRVAGCDREIVARRGLCRFHDQRLPPPGLADRRGAGRLGRWRAAPPGGAPVLPCRAARAGAHRAAYALQHRDQAPPPLDPTEVRILLALGAAARPHCAKLTAGRLRVRRHAVQRGTRGLFPTCAGTWTGPGPSTRGADPFARRRVAVALLDLPVNAPAAGRPLRARSTSA